MKVYLIILIVTFSILDLVYLKGTGTKSKISKKTVSSSSKKFNKCFNRIIGGEEISISKIPYQVSVVERKVYLPFCGGTIISKKHVITSARCIDIEKKYDIIIGSVTVGVGTRVRVAKTNNHPKYDDEKKGYDISVLTLERKLKFNKKVKSIALPKKGEKYKFGCKAIVSGFGSTEDGTVLSQTLKAVEVPILKPSKCKELVYPYVPYTLCAGYYTAKKNSCQGDFGGPLVLDNKLIGVVLFGVGCGIFQHTGVYTDVAKYIDFIMNATNKLKV